MAEQWIVRTRRPSVVSPEQTDAHQNGLGQAQKNPCAEVSIVGIFEDSGVKVDGKRTQLFSKKRAIRNGRPSVSQKIFFSMNDGFSFPSTEQQTGREANHRGVYDRSSDFSNTPSVS